jgi:hypothetical protein
MSRNSRCTRPANGSGRRGSTPLPTQAQRRTQAGHQLVEGRDRRPAARVTTATPPSRSTSRPGPPSSSPTSPPHRAAPRGPRRATQPCPPASKPRRFSGWLLGGYLPHIWQPADAHRSARPGSAAQHLCRSKIGARTAVRHARPVMRPERSASQLHPDWVSAARSCLETAAWSRLARYPALSRHWCHQVMSRRWSPCMVSRTVNAVSPPGMRGTRAASP